MVVSSIGNGGALAAMAVLLVAMAGGTYFRGCIPQGRVKVEPAVSIAVAKVAAYGASRSFPVGPGEGRLTEPTAVIHPWRRELVFLPHKRPSRSAWDWLSWVDCRPSIEQNYHQRSSSRPGLSTRTSSSGTPSS